jgi:hypothetical protein
MLRDVTSIIRDNSNYCCTYFTLFYYSLLSHPKLLPLRSVPGRQDVNTPCYLSSFFFPLSTRPTRRRNSTVLAELGWMAVIELP